MTDDPGTSRRPWTPQEINDFEHAVDIYRSLLAEINGRIHAEPDPRAADLLQAEAIRYVQEQRALRPTDHQGVRRVIDEYPALIRRMRDAQPQ